MKIGMENLTNIYGTKSVRETGAAARQSAKAEETRQFDKMILTSNPREAAEKIFTEKLSETLKREVLAEEDKSEKINALKTAIAEGSYVPNSAEIASRILLFGGQSV